MPRNEGESFLTTYRQHVGRKTLFLLAVLFVLFGLAVFSIAKGAVAIPLDQVVSIVLGNRQGTWGKIIWNIRMPRVFTALAAGMGLSVAGVAMQSILRNPLGSPFTLGISQAAAFGAAFAIVILGAGTQGSSAADAVVISDLYLVTACAFSASLLSALVVVFLAKFRQVKPETMILTGVALGSLFTAGTTAIQYFASDLEIASIVFWTFGDVSRTTWSELHIMGALVAVTTAYFLRHAWNYNALNSGDETAKSFGVNVEALRLWGMLISSFVTALIVSLVGIIGFVGLVVPHLVRKVIGGNEAFLIPGSCLVGGCLLLMADTAARTVMAPVVLPVGILTSFLGAPLFIYLVLKGREYW